MLIFIYSRKSVFTGKGESIENQVEMCKSYILNNIKGARETDISVYEDEGFSAKNTNRPQFQKMLSDAKSQKADYIVCYRLDRISRSVSDFSSLIEDLNSKKINFICIKEQFDTSTPMGRAMMYIASVFAQLERETIAERVRDNMIMLARTGRWLGGPAPTGFTTEKQTEIIIDGKIKTSCSLKVNNSEIEIVKTVYETFLKSCSLSKVCKDLTDKNIKSQKGNYFTPIAIKDILSNPVYCCADKDAFDYFISKGSDVCFDKKLCSSSYGLTSYNRRNYNQKGCPRTDKSKWIIAIGKHKGIIKGKDWIQVQNILDKNKTISPTRNNYALLSGMITCEKCGEKMFAKIHSRDTSGKVFYYVCGNKMRFNKTICDCPNLNGPQTDDIVCNYLINYINSDNEISKALNKYKSEFKDDKSREKLHNIEEKIYKLKENKEKYVSHLLDVERNSPMVKVIEEQVKKADEQIQILETEKIKYNEKLKSNFNKECNLELVVKTLSFFKENFSKMEIDDKKSLLKLVIEKLTWNGKNLNIFIYGE